MVDEMTNGQMAKYAVLMIGLAAIVLAGMAVTDQYSQVLRDETTFNGSGENTVATLAAVNVSQVLSSYPYLQNLDGCINGSNATDTALVKTTEYTFGEGDEDGGIMTLTDSGSEWVGNDINCSVIEYLAESTAQGHADKFTTGLAIFGTFLAIIVLSLVGKIIVGIFKPKEG